MRFFFFIYKCIRQSLSFKINQINHGNCNFVYEIRFGAFVSTKNDVVIQKPYLKTIISCMKSLTNKQSPMNT